MKFNCSKINNMKKILITCLFALPLCASAQWTNTGNNYTTGSVLINGGFQSSANYGLVLVPTSGDAVINRNNPGNMVISSGAGTSEIRLNYSYGGGSGGVLVYDGGTTNYGAFKVNSSGNLSVSAYGGNVGIGAMTNPQSRLDIASTQGSGLQFRYDLTTGYRIQLVPYWNSGTDTRLDFNIGRVVNQAPVTTMSVGYGNNVGIGTTSPSYKLDIINQPGESHNLLRLRTDSAPNDYFSVSNGTGVANQFIPVITGYHTSANREALYLTGAIGTTNDSGGQPIMCFDSRIINAPVATRPLFAWDSYGNRKMTMTANGSLGIGTAATGSFKLAVEGKIGAREVIVTLASPWPDYVFEDEYKLPSLLEVEKYIKTNKHLPDVPTAQQVKDNGLSVGEMNVILLKKVEELTLHLIEQQKIIQQQGARIATLEGQMK
jgi:hypothetical protein